MPTLSLGIQSFWWSRDELGFPWLPLVCLIKVTHKLGETVYLWESVYYKGHHHGYRWKSTQGKVWSGGSRRELPCSSLGSLPSRTLQMVCSPAAWSYSSENFHWDFSNQFSFLPFSPFWAGQELGVKVSSSLWPQSSHSDDKVKTRNSPGVTSLEWRTCLSLRKFPRIGSYVVIYQNKRLPSTLINQTIITGF